MVGDFDAEVSGAGVDGQPRSAFVILAVFNKVVAASERAETLVEDAFLKLDATAEVGNETGVYPRCLINKIGSGTSGSLILTVQEPEQFLFVQTVLLTYLSTHRDDLADAMVEKLEIVGIYGC